MIKVFRFKPQKRLSLLNPERKTKGQLTLFFGMCMGIGKTHLMLQEGIFLIKDGYPLVLAYYNLGILAIFLVGNSLYVCWILLFMRYRRELDIRRFAQAAGEQSSLIQLVTAMQEIKLNNCEKQKRWQWERIQVKLFKISVKGLALGQTQQVGSIFFNQTTNIVISFIAAKSVVDGEMTLGMMMSLTYIIGQLSGPIGSNIGLVQRLQDA